MPATGAESGPPREGVPRASRRAELALLIVLIGSSFIGLSGRLLSAHDESRYAEIAREMLESGDFVTPRLSGIEHWDKPPLTYWAIAGSFALLGLNEFAARVPSALAAIGSVIAVYGVGRMLFGRRAGVLSGIVLGSSPLFVLVGRLATPDMLLTCWVCWTVHWLVRGGVHGDRRGAGRGDPRGVWAVLRGAFVGLGFMTKGPVVFLFTVVPVLLFVLIRRDWRSLRAARPWLSALAFCVVALPWFVVVCAQNEGLLSYLVGFQTLSRVLTNVHHRAGSVLYYVPVLLCGCAPWVLYLPLACVRGASRASASAGREGSRGAGPLLVVLFAVPFVCLSLVTSKGLVYLLPAVPAASVLVGRLLDDELGLGKKWSKGFVANTAIAAVVILVSLAWAGAAFWGYDVYPNLSRLGNYVALFLVLVGAGMVTAQFALVRRMRWLLVGALATPVPVLAVVTLATLPDMSDQVSWEAPGKHFAERLAGRMEKDDRLVFYGSASHSTSFYLRRRPVFVACNVDARFMTAGELDGWVISGGAAGGPAAALRGVFDEAEAHGHRVFCTALEADYRALVADPAAPTTYLLAKRRRTVLFSNEPDVPLQRSR